MRQQKRLVLTSITNFSARNLCGVENFFGTAPDTPSQGLMAGTVTGGNAFSFSTNEHVDTFMADDWPWFTAPIAYDLSLHVGATAGYSVAQSYGFPESADQEPGEVGMSVSGVRKRIRTLRAKLQQQPEFGVSGVGAPI